jgi:dipeptidyl aminopeptidase/acylaminoacyl peptidase
VNQLAARFLAVLILLAGGTAPNFNRQSDVIYGRKFGTTLTMEVFTPTARKGLGVLWVVSSSGRSSREQTLQESFERRITPLLDRGYTVFAVIHGSAPVFNLQDQVSDVRRAVRFVRQRAAQFGVDGERLGIAGASAGGMLALMVAMHGDDGNGASEDVVERTSDRVQAIGCFFPPTDLMNYGNPGVTVVDLMRERDGRVDATFQFYDLDRKTEERQPITAREDILRLLREYSPVSHVNAATPPTLLVHGDRDQAVPIQQSRRMIEALHEQKVPSRLLVREGMGHAYPGWEADSALLADWFDQHLRAAR